MSEGGIRWKLLNVAPELGSWAALYDCPKGSSFANHVHIGPGEYFLTKGLMEVRGGANEGGVTVKAPAYGYEACQAYHGKTYFHEDSELIILALLEKKGAGIVFIIGGASCAFTGYIIEEYAYIAFMAALGAALTYGGFYVGKKMGFNIGFNEGKGEL